MYVFYSATADLLVVKLHGNIFKCVFLSGCRGLAFQPQRGSCRLWRGLSGSSGGRQTRAAPGAPPAQGGPRRALCAPHLVCRHRKVWIGKGMPRPLSCSWPSELFLFTMMVAPGSPSAGPSAGSALATPASSSSSSSRCHIQPQVNLL